MKRIAYIGMVLIPAALLLASCYPKGFRGGIPNYEYFVKSGRSVPLEQVKRDMVECGYAPERGYVYRENTPFADTPGINYSRSDNEKVLGQECMFAKGYVFVDGWGGLCSNPVERYGPRALPNCKDVPIRPRQR